MHLHGLLGARELPVPVRPPTKPKRTGYFSRIVLGLAAVCGIVVAAVWTQRQIEEQLRRAEQARIEAAARTAQADAMSWNLVAGMLLDNETKPDTEAAPPSSRTQPVLRSPDQVLRLHQDILARQSGPAWDHVSPGQRSNLTAILNAHIGAFELARRTTGLEDQLYGRKGLSLASGLQPKDAEGQFNSISELPLVFARISSAWGTMPSPLPRNRVEKALPRDRVEKLLGLSKARIELIDAEVALLRFLAQHAQERRARRLIRINVPMFEKRELQREFSRLLDAESARYANLLATISRLLDKTLSPQLKPLLR
jgi:hypothetical protein